MGEGQQIEKAHTGITTDRFLRDFFNSMGFFRDGRTFKYVTN